MGQPKLKIELKPIDQAIELTGLLALLLLLGLPIYFFNQLPETIPIHFGANGEPDGFSGKAMIWTLPVIGFVSFLGMFWLNKYPHVFNYSQKITEENAERQYTVATRMIRTLNAIITCVFAYLVYSTIQTALGNQSGLGSWFSPIIMILIFGTTGYFLFQSRRKKNATG